VNGRMMVAIESAWATTLTILTMPPVRVVGMVLHRSTVLSALHARRMEHRR
jgi:hypothetical protein